VGGSLTRCSCIDAPFLWVVRFIVIGTVSASGFRSASGGAFFAERLTFWGGGLNDKRRRLWIRTIIITVIV